VKENDQLMAKLRLRRLLQEILDSDLVQLEVEESSEAVEGAREPIKRIALVARYFP
jgi:hypothetical protein